MHLLRVCHSVGLREFLQWKALQGSGQQWLLQLEGTSGPLVLSTAGWVTYVT